MVLDLEAGRMVPRKWWVSENFGSISKSPKQFVWVSKYRFRVIFASRSLDFFLPMGLVVSDLSFFLNSVWSSGVAFFQSLWVQLIELYPGSRGPFSKYLMWNKPVVTAMFITNNIITGCNSEISAFLSPFRSVAKQSLAKLRTEWTFLEEDAFFLNFSCQTKDVLWTGADPALK